MPARSTVHLWLANIEGFSDQYARACEIRADVYADQIVEIADDASRDWVTKKNRTARPIRFLTGSMCSGLGCGLKNARKWLMSKMAPKKYGDRVEVGGNSDAPLRHCVQVEFVKPGTA